MADGGLLRTARLGLRLPCRRICGAGGGVEGKRLPSEELSPGLGRADLGGGDIGAVDAFAYEEALEAIVLAVKVVVSQEIPEPHVLIGVYRQDPLSARDEDLVG